MRTEDTMNKNTATIIISLLGICAISSVALLVYVMISAPPSFPATSSFIQSTPIALVDQSQSVPQPTFTATPTLVAAVQTNGKGCLTSLDYLNKIELIAGGWEEFTPDFIDLMDKVNKNPNLISDPSWQPRMEIDLAKFDKSAGQLQALKAPRGLLKVDAQYKLAAAELLAFTSDAREAIQKQDIDALKISNPHMDNFKNYMDKANSAIKAAKYDDTCE